MLRPFYLKNRWAIAWTLSLELLCYFALVQTPPLLSQQPLEVEFNLINLPSCRQSLAVLNSPGLATFENRPLGECLRKFAELCHVAIWIDRRVDISRLVSIVGVGTNEPTESKTTLGRLVAIAKAGGADARLIENVVYIGPTERVDNVQRAAIRLHNEIMTQRKAIPNGERVELRTLSWEELTTPAELLDSIQKRWSVIVTSELPHDLMHAGELPSSTLATQLTLLHAGFDLQIECESSGQFKASPLALETIWKADYSDKELQIGKLTAARRDFPNATVQTRGKISSVTGPTEFHLRLLAVRIPTARNIEPKFTIPEFRAPLERVIGDLAKHLNMQVEWSQEIPQSKRQAIVTFGVAEAKSADGILQQIAAESGLKIRRQQQTIEVLP